MNLISVITRDKLIKKLADSVRQYNKMPDIADEADTFYKLMLKARIQVLLELLQEEFKVV